MRRLDRLWSCGTQSFSSSLKIIVIRRRLQHDKWYLNKVQPTLNPITGSSGLGVKVNREFCADSQWQQPQPRPAAHQSRGWGGKKKYGKTRQSSQAMGLRWLYYPPAVRQPRNGAHVHEVCGMVASLLWWPILQELGARSAQHSWALMFSPINSNAGRGIVALRTLVVARCGARSRRCSWRNTNIKTGLRYQ